MVLDAGCGPGGNGAWLRSHGTVIGVDVSPEALEHVRLHHAGTVPVQGDAAALPFAGASFDVVVAVTVLYTVPDDTGAVRELARVTKPGGAIALVEPAFESLRRAHDATVHGRRRYRTHDLEALAGAAGLTIRRATYAYSFLAPAAYALARLDRVRAASTESAESPSDVERRSLDRVFAPLARIERRALAHRDVPVGTSVLLLATRD
jgi:SAM-dependent methyltransferase